MFLHVRLKCCCKLNVVTNSALKKTFYALYIDFINVYSSNRSSKEYRKKNIILCYYEN